MTLPTWATPFTDNTSTIPADFLNSYVRTQIPRAIDGVGGGIYTPSTVIDIQGTAGLKLSATGSAARLQYGSRSISRVSTALINNPTAGTIAVAYNDVAAGDTASTALDRLPNNSVLATLQVYVDRVDTGVLPTTRVRLALYKTNVITGADTTIVAVTEDPTATLAAYEAHHAVTFSSIGETIDNTRYVYWIALQGEAGANTSTVRMFAPITTCTVTEQDEAP